jgi:two-component system, OmpR family, sensor kinase
VPATGGDGRWRVAVQPLRDGGSVVVAASLDGIDSTTRQLRLIDLVVSVVVLLALAGVGAVIVRASLCARWSRSSRRPGRSRPAT